MLTLLGVDSTGPPGWLSDAAARDGIDTDLDTYSAGIDSKQITVVLEPSTATIDEIREAEIERAFQRVSNLEQYSDEQLASVTRWVVRVKDGFAPDVLAGHLNVPSVTPSDLLERTYFYDTPVDLPTHRAVSQLQGISEVEYFYPLVPLKREPRHVPNDPYFDDQWYLRNDGRNGGTVGEDVNVVPAWNRVRGNGVVIGIVDDGLDWAHRDLAPHYRADLSWDYIDGDNDPMPPFDPEQGRVYDSHGTKSAGIAAAAGNNRIGIAGVAYLADLAGIRMGNVDQIDQIEADALSHESQQIDIYNNGWGPADAWDWLAAPGPLAMAALRDGVAVGRGGLGSIYTWAAGNGLEFDDNVNYDGYANSRYTIAVGAIDHFGRQSEYSEPGAPILVTAPTGGSYGLPGDLDYDGLVTTDISGEGGVNQTGTDEGYYYNNFFVPDPAYFPDIDYTEKFNGTSATAAMVSGVAALMLEANPSLSYRDVQHILVESARQNDPADADWTVNGAGYDVNHKYGFGALDASAAVNLAQAWHNVRPEKGLIYNTIAINHAIADQTYLEVTLGIPDDLVLEWVEVTMNITHPHRADLKIELESPDGTISVLADEHLLDDGADYDNWTLTTPRHWGESLVGDWKLRVYDLDTGDEGTWDDFTLAFFGTDAGTGTVTGTKFEDLDGDGVRDANERGLGDFVIFGDGNGNGTLDPYEPWTRTEADGSYTLELIPNWQYTIHEIQQAGWTQTSPATGGHPNITLADQQIVGGMNFGNDPDPFTVTGVIWADVTPNGVFDSFEDPMGGVEVYLDVDPRDGPDYLPGVDILTVSANDGSYSLSSGDVVGPGIYVVKQRVSPNFRQAFPISGEHVVMAEPGDVISGNDFGNIPDPVQLIDFVPTPSGFVADFSAPLYVQVLNLYDVKAATLGPADVTVEGDTVGAVHGSLVVRDDRLTFVATGGPLSPDTYTVTLRSAAKGFRYLDGDGDGTFGDDFVTTFTVDSDPSVVVSLPDFTRGPLQPVQVPANARGLPLIVSDAGSVLSVDATIHYDPTLLTVTGATVGDEMPADAEVVFNAAVPGEISVSFSCQGLPAGPAEIVVLSAEVPSPAAYGAVQVLDITTVSINGGALPATADDAIHVAAYFGDTTGNQTYSGLDAQRVGRVVVELDTGFEAYPAVDPLIIADITANGGLSSLDAQRIARQAAGLDAWEIPPLPGQPQRLDTAAWSEPSRQTMDLTLPPNSAGRIAPWHEVPQPLTSFLHEPGQVQRHHHENRGLIHHALPLAARSLPDARLSDPDLEDLDDAVEQSELDPDAIDKIYASLE